MSAELSTLKDAYLDAVRLCVWYTPSPFSLVQGKASNQLAAQHRIQAQVLWIQYLTKKNGKST